MTYLTNITDTSRIRPAGKLRPKSGFALIVTLSLMILLTVVAVGLLTLSTISLRTASRGDAMARAQSNAKLSLMMALGKLQMEMGPDSRISAAHDAGKESSGGDPCWVATYEAWKREQSASTPESPDSRAPEFRSWLVSGMESDVPPPSADRVLMVGPGSLGSPAAAVNQVRVPSTPVNVDRNRGRIAWWVADEGMKAKVTAGRDPGGAASFGASDPLFHSQAPPHIGHQAVAALSAHDWKPGERAITVTQSQLDLAAGLPNNGVGGAFHDITVHSAGVLADVRAGRLKRDLSNLLARPVTQLENKPLYLADGRINWLDIGANGQLASTSGIPSSWRQGYNSNGHWGINFEELHLFHSLHREITWSGSKPSLQMKNTRETAVADRHFLYKRPATQALQFIFSLKAVPEQNPANGYKMQMHMDAMVALWNPNDVALVYPPGLHLPFQLLSLPYNLQWNIKKTAGGINNSVYEPGNLNVFAGHIEGGASGGPPPAGFTLEPGESATFGSSTSQGYQLNLSRGFAPTGSVALVDWDLKAGGLKLSDQIDFSLKRSTRLSSGAWTYFNTWIGPRLGAQSSWQMDSGALFDLPSPAHDPMLPQTINPPQSRPVSDFIGNPQPFLLLSFLQNVEQPSGTMPTDAFASRPFQLTDPAINERSFRGTRLENDRHATQLLITAEAMNYEMRTLAAGAGGRHIFIGGGRQANLGGTFNMLARRIPITPPLSIGAFQNAIASGFADRFTESFARSQVGGNQLITGGGFPSNAVALTGHLHGLPLVSKAIGNSYTIPHLPADKVYQSSPNITVAARGSAGNVATDHSWMSNTALWDSWFLSGIVDGTATGSSAWQTDARSPRDQFEDFAKDGKPLRNSRFIFHSHETPDKVIDRMFAGENFRNDAINLLPNYLLLDGAFNVNSTSVTAWSALLASVRSQSLKTASGSSTTFDHPLGTLGYAVSAATSGTEGDWMGLRDLNNDEIKKLAEEIVTEVKGRGPFLSLADFVNRRPNSPNPQHQVVGALQAAIDRSGLNDRVATASRSLSPQDFGSMAGRSSVGDEPAPSRAIGRPGHLAQADLLSALGSQIAVRSDTFIIRGYGDARDSSDRIVATAWCEALIQRVPEYVDPVDSPEAQKGWPAPSNQLSPVNSKFGRRFVIRSFRWLPAAGV